MTVNGDQALDLPVRRMGVVEGTLSADAPPVTIRFESAEDPSLSGDAECATAERWFRCEIPERTLDLRIGSTGRVPHYRFGVAIATEHPLALGQFQLIEGASLSGRLKSEEESLRGARVTLTRGGQTLASVPSSSGFFQFGPVPPGDYTLTAMQKGLISAPVAVTIRDGQEARLRDAVMLAKPRSLALSIALPMNPIGRPWIVQLAPEGTNDSAGSAASADGSWRAGNLAPGKYVLRARPDGGPAWHIEEISIDDPVTTKHLLLQPVRFRASVRMSSKPLAAKVVFGGEHSPTPIPFRSGDDGKIEGYLPTPEDGLWRVTVRSEQPKIVATLKDVAVTTNDAGVASIDIVVPATGIEGEVLSPDGKAAKHAIVNIAPADAADGEFMQVTTDEGGRFLTYGVPAGTYSLSASDYLAESRSVRITVDENDESPARIQLKLEPMRKWAGIATLPDGRPVAGAKISASAIDFPTEVALSEESGPDGRFTVIVPSSARIADVRVAAFGYTFATFRREITNEPLAVVVDPRGATLVIDYERSATHEPYLSHNGVTSPAVRLVAEWLATLDDHTLRIPNSSPANTRSA